MMLRGLRRVRQRWLRLVHPTAMVLLYHRVSCGGADPWGLSVSPDNFDRHLTLLRRYGFRLMSMRELVKALATSGLPKRSAVITFDDGYADNLHEALPVLTRHDAPATIFVTAGQIESGREFWWDTLTRVLLETDVLPDRFEALGSGTTREWRLDAGSFRRSAGPGETPGWRIRDPAPTVRHEMCRTLWKELSGLPSEDRDAAVDSIAEWAGTSPLSPDPLRRPLTGPELQRLGSSPLVEIGGHTWSHPPLSSLSPSRQADELGASKTWLEQAIGSPVTGCSYPYGSYCRLTLQAAREAGYAYAASSEMQPVRSGANPLALPRVTVKDWAAAEFEALLRRFGF